MPWFERHGKPRIPPPRRLSISRAVNTGIQRRYAYSHFLISLGLNSVTVFGMSLELSGLLSVYSAIMSGNITSVSIGGKPKTNAGLIGGLTTGLGLLGQPEGLSASHNRFEADCSPTRGDLYKT
jgi:hypothetical protein